MDSNTSLISCFDANDSRAPQKLAFRGWTLLMGNTRPECFLRGLKFSDKKIRGLKFLGENLRGLKSISKFDQIFLKISVFLEDTDPNI